MVELRLFFAGDHLAFHLPVNLNRRPASREYTRTCGSQNAVSVRLIERLAGAVNGRCREAAGIAGGFVSSTALREVPSIGCFVTRIHPSRYRHNLTLMNISASIVALGGLGSCVILRSFCRILQYIFDCLSARYRTQ